MEEFVQTVKDLLENRQWQELKALLAPQNPNDLAHIFAEFAPSERAWLFRLLEKQEAVEVFESLPLEEQQELLGSFKQEQLREIVEHMSPDDRAYLLEELPAKVAKRLLGLLTPEELAATAMLLGYGENTAGRIMTPEYIDLKSFVTVGQALEKIRRVGLDKETIYYSYVTDEQRRLIGIVSIRQLVLADPETQVQDIMKQDNIVHAHTDDDQEEVAHKMQKYDLLAIPVVDREDRLVGIVTHDDVIDIIQDEVTEDIYRLGALEVPEQSYFKPIRLAVVSPGGQHHHRQYHHSLFRFAGVRHRAGRVCAFAHRQRRQYRLSDLHRVRARYSPEGNHHQKRFSSHLAGNLGGSAFGGPPGVHRDSVGLLAPGQLVGGHRRRPQSLDDFHSGYFFRQRLAPGFPAFRTGSGHGVRTFYQYRG